MKEPMSNHGCIREGELTAALRTGDLPERMKSHASQCEKCGEILQIAQGMAQIAHEEIHNRAGEKLPDATMLWRRAQFFQPEESAVKSRLEWIQFIGEMAVPVGFAMWIALNWFAIESVTQQTLVSAWPEMAAVSYAVASLAPAALVICALALAYPTVAAE